MRDALRVNVRTLAEFYTEGGDLIYTGNAMERMREGMLGHQEIQSSYADGWEKEVSLSLDIESEGLSLRLYGRADGILRATCPPVIEEIKTTERPIQDIGADDVPAHWAQAELYGAMLCEKEGFDSVEIRLTYLNLSGGRISFTRTFARQTLHDRMLTYSAPYAKWLSALLHWRNMSRPTMQSLSFPFEGYRAGQREMAANVYISLRDSKRLLCQAPTGIGKTAASLYPALKALGEGRIDRIFFLTARTTGQLAACNALHSMRKCGLTARSVTLSARDKVCIQPGTLCGPDACPRARGYFDRRRAALYESLSMQDFSPEAIRSLCDRHELCPFEFSLDLSETADIVICDYNYVFDPRVKLQRFFTNKSDAGLLIDEAHNLPSRARGMLSSSLSHRAFRDLRAQVGKESGRKHPLYKALTPLLTAFKELRVSFADAEEIRREMPEALIAVSKEALSLLAEHMNTPAAWNGCLTDCFFALNDFLRCAETYNEHYRTLLTPDGKSMSEVTLWCVNPAPHLAKVLRRVHGATLFSATLSPLTFYRDLTGLSEEEGDALLDLPSPFPPENLLVMRAPLPVRYRQREQSLPKLARLIASFVRARTGNYLVFFPSYAYMQQALEEIRPLLGEDIRLLVQDREMNDVAREAYLSEFQPEPEQTLCAAAVLGGAFSEGIDLKDNRLTGAVIVGTGVPQIGAANDALREVYEEQFHEGYRYAYMYPGAARVLQAAGRVIRSESDRGAVLLIDNRWMEAAHTQLLPPHWQTETVWSETQLTDRLSAFFGGFR